MNSEEMRKLSFQGIENNKIAQKKKEEIENQKEIAEQESGKIAARIDFPKILNSIRDVASRGEFVYTTYVGTDESFGKTFILSKTEELVALFNKDGFLTTVNSIFEKAHYDGDCGFTSDDHYNYFLKIEW